MTSNELKSVEVNSHDNKKNIINIYDTTWSYDLE